jgi:hypothetical protein
MSRRGYQQGDVILAQVGMIPEDCERETPHARGNVVAEGEVTGHAHVLEPDTSTLFLSPNTGRRFVQVRASTALTHEEHDTQVIAPGLYEIDQVVEKDWLEDAIRPVVD